MHFTHTVDYDYDCRVTLSNYNRMPATRAPPPTGLPAILSNHAAILTDLHRGRGTTISQHKQTTSAEPVLGGLARGQSLTIGVGHGQSSAPTPPSPGLGRGGALTTGLPPGIGRGVILSASSYPNGLDTGAGGDAAAKNTVVNGNPALAQANAHAYTARCLPQSQAINGKSSMRGIGRGIDIISNPDLCLGKLAVKREEKVAA